MTGGSGAQPTPTYDPNEFNLTPTITPPPKEQGPPPPQWTPEPSSPYGQGVHVDFGPPPSVEQLVQGRVLIITGRVIRLLPAQWTTPDAQRPSNPFAENPEQTTIITPVIVELDAPPLVDRFDTTLSGGQQLAVAAFGGQVGEDSVTTNDPSQHFSTGERVLLVLVGQLAEA